MQYDYRYVRKQQFSDSISEKEKNFKPSVFIEKVVLAIMIIIMVLISVI